MVVRPKIPGVIACLMLCAAADTASAQAQTPLNIAINNNLGIQQAILNNVPMNTAFRNSQSRYSEKPRVERSRPAPRMAAPSRSDSGDLRADGFHVPDDPAVSAQVRETFLANTRQSKGEEYTDELDHLLGDVRTTFSRMTSPYGLRADDFADVMAAYTVVLWMSANRETRLPQVSQVRGVRQQMRAALAGRSDDARQRQSLAETIMYQTCMLVAMREQAEQGKPEILDTLAAAIDKGSAQTGDQLRQMVLTDQGLVQR